MKKKKEKIYKAKIVLLVKLRSTSKNKQTNKYSDSYLTMDFTWTRSEDFQRQLWVICYKVLSNEGFKPTKLH
jgi:hypothetical protein